MKDKTLKLSGHAKDRFLERFFAGEPGLPIETARRLTARGKTTFTSLRVRAIATYPIRKLDTTKPATPPPAIVSAPSPLPGESAAPTAPFDAYAIGLVPIFQREGRDGLIARLASVANLEHLRQMSKAQQIVLPQELRTGEIPLEKIRAAIADAVARRIADRRAAAG